MSQELVIRGRRIAEPDLFQIQRVTADHWDKGRTFISQELCRIWDWRQPNGVFKDQICRILLRKLESKGLITLPPPKRGVSNHPKRRYYIPPDPPPTLCTNTIEGTVGQYPRIQLQMVRRTPNEALWNFMMYQYHYKSYRITVGAHLKYMAFIDERPIACLVWSSCVFRIQDRDKFIGWNKEMKSKNIGMLANNSRFLILPWVHIKNLASHLLGRSAKILAKDWLNFYQRPLYLLETFVDRARFAGTCYQAANWINVGQTKGFSKKSNKFEYHGQPKDIYVYPLIRNFRSKLVRSAQGGE